MYVSQVEFDKLTDYQKELTTKKGKSNKIARVWTTILFVCLIISSVGLGYTLFNPLPTPVLNIVNFAFSVYFVAQIFASICLSFAWLVLKVAQEVEIDNLSHKDFYGCLLPKTAYRAIKQILDVMMDTILFVILVAIGSNFTAVFFCIFVVVIHLANEGIKNIVLKYLQKEVPAEE